ncbi:hypothetical protein [Rhodococcus sp. USK13]|uniref:hypothetical protein n=1 Tax=Rhodococcus sp. USK13 TaxID=2806442 RepID=UPI001BCFC2E0|nr:hypothetical protein [Rhodococcus sp. USK13]
MGLRNKHTVTVGGRFREVDSLAEALVLWAQHLAADLVTPMSLPMPGSSWLYELDNRALRTFAHEVYLGTSAGNGLNVRSGILTPSLSVVTTEVILCTHVHARRPRSPEAPAWTSGSRPGAASCSSQPIHWSGSRRRGRRWHG